MSICESSVSLNELNFRLATAARMPTAIEQAREREQLVRAGLHNALLLASAAIWTYDLILLVGT